VQVLIFLGMIPTEKKLRIPQKRHLFNAINFNENNDLNLTNIPNRNRFMRDRHDWSSSRNSSFVSKNIKSQK
jgi:hypothetical protein